jgi:hypothetical protein
VDTLVFASAVAPKDLAVILSALAGAGRLIVFTQVLAPIT